MTWAEAIERVEEMYDLHISTRCIGNEADARWAECDEIVALLQRAESMELEST